VSRVFGEFSSDIAHKNKICYARVSSDHQKEDLERQVEILDKLYPRKEIIKDIGSGLNFK
jgi:predicted site-specific integrase-resolvase